MPHKDPEKRREYGRNYRAANREKRREYEREHSEEQRLKLREYKRQWRRRKIASDPAYAERQRECTRDYHRNRRKQRFFDKIGYSYEPITGGDTCKM